MRIPGAEKAINNLIKWSRNEKWAPIQDQVFAEHLGPVREIVDFNDGLDLEEEDLYELFGPAFDVFLCCVSEDFFTARFGDEGENVIDDYLKRRGWREKVPGKRYLEALRDSDLSLYEVVDLDPGRSLTVKDLIRAGDPITVAEKRGSETAAKWDRFAARIVTVNKKVYFTGSLLLFPHEVADELLSKFEGAVEAAMEEARRHAGEPGWPASVTDQDVRELLLEGSVAAFTQAWLTDALSRAFAPPPQLCNSDGHDILVSEVRFPLMGDLAKVVAALESIGDLEREEPEGLAWSWLAAGTPTERLMQPNAVTQLVQNDDGVTILGHFEIGGDALVLSTNSKERAERGQEMIQARLGSLLGQPLVSYKDLDSLPEEEGESEDLSSELTPEVAAEAIGVFLEDHYRQALDNPLPYLDGKTPREAAMTEEGRSDVIGWLKMLENSEVRRAAKLGQQPFDFQWMWREMNLELPR